MDEIDRVQQRTVSAAGAPPTGVDPALGSPFALGQKYLQESGHQAEEEEDMTATNAPAAAGTAATGRHTGPRGPHLATRVRMTIESCAPITEAKLAETLEPADPARIRELVIDGAKDGKWRRKRDGQGGFVIELAKPAGATAAGQPRGLQGFLARQGRKPGRNGAAKRAGSVGKGVAAPKARKAPVKAVRPARGGRGVTTPVQLLPAAPTPARAPAPPAGLDCGLHNTGDLHIAVGAERLVLNKQQARALVDYLDKIASAIREE